MAIGVATTCTGVASGIVGMSFLCLPCSFSTRSVLAKVNMIWCKRLFRTQQNQQQQSLPVVNIISLGSR